MEGLSYEAGSLAGTNGLGKLLYFYDDNHITIDGTTSISFTEDRAKRFEALGWHVQYVHDANDLDALRDGDRRTRSDETDKPSIVVVRSHIALRRAEGGRHGEGARLARSARTEVAATKKALGWDPDKHFYVPDEVYEHMNQVERGNELETEWQQRLRGVVGDVPARARDSGTPPGPAGSAPWTPPDVRARRGARDARRRQGGHAGVQATPSPTMIGGAADLVESTKTEFEGGGLFSDQLVGTQHRVRDPRARDGLDRERHRGARRLRQAVRLDVPDLQRLHAPGGPALGADGAAGRRGRGRTTRSGSARTARRTSPSRRTRRCARSRTSGSCAPPTRTRPP